ncbi:hypothetical protein LTR91_025500 [Friedmanniomyces endolithicus]|uniref:CFEM domain-containing protein n=1 Tax=Friedmanniomyces endolithicus TaxID=329885 RepID=A0AAN6JWI2_9PEZI|nr:hypothetical protein LTR94_018409 [Friedmanniomyces endolithicus]KAK0777149.1 hypothetical protein LTR38_015253 [Friedmanniomyces endolithicus]KAK0779756.1 hypothetical protein LTR75_015240 [Friedmanniomyces endolithicus]KAK0787454.1 hypothetical protein LTR59_010320 [Friedmanniomyces endolithicus]KAK0832452.1 hypothetical protein LTR03_015209 [Friedmanniomyces endolithicus]
MRASTSIPVLLAALASVAVSVSIPGLPACAGNCVTSFGNCAQLAVGCICSDTTLLANLACCVGSNCDAADQNTTITFADALCAGQSVTNLPMAATCAPGAASTPLGTASSSGSSTTGSSSATTSAAASASSASTASVASSAATTSALAAASTSKSAGEMVYGVGSVGLGLVFAGIVAAL